MSEIFTTILYQPIFNSFVGLYNLIPDVGVVILIITLVLKGVLYPLTSSSIKAQKSLQDLQPKMKDLKEKYKDDQQKMAQETMKLYKEHKVNPLGSCLPILIQLPVFLALYWVLRAGLSSDNFDLLYSFVSNPGHINQVTLGLIDLSKSNSIESGVLAVLAGGAQYIQAKSMQTKRAPKEAGKGGKDEDMMSMMNKQMLYFMPFITVFIGWQLPAGLALYWFLSTILTAAQQHVLFNKGKKKEGAIEGKIIE